MNRKYILFINAADTSRHTASANTAIYPNLGLLTLMSALEPRLKEGPFQIGYFDGTVYGNSTLTRFIEDNHEFISALCFSALTSNHGASVAFANHAKKLNPSILVVFGNDHFSALYKEVMLNRSNVDYGFCGNDVVEGFSDFIFEKLNNQMKDLSCYPGLVYRDKDGTIRKNPENQAEYTRIPLVNYSLMDSLMPHQKRYSEGQAATYFFMRNRELSSQVIDIGRGCIKFSGPRDRDIPINACDFCGIIPGSKAIASPSAERAWKIIQNAYQQGFNYLYVTTDELPLTVWPLLRNMAAALPDWYQQLPPSERPKMFGYARAEAFATRPERIDTLVTQLGFDHFFVGFDGLTDLSLRVMNKQPVGKSYAGNLVVHNLKAMEQLVSRGCLVTAGMVVTHLGITPQLMSANYELLKELVDAHPKSFAALDFGPLCPIPGSQSFRYLTDPSYAEQWAMKHGLRVNRTYLESIAPKYSTGDDFEMDELIHDFITGCCPDISMSIFEEFMEKITALCRKHAIVVGGGV